MTTYSLQNAARILKVAPSRLRYWKRTQLAVPRARAPSSEDGASGVAESPADSSYEFRDLIGLKAVLSLLEQGISLRRIRRSVELLRERIPEIEDPLVALRLWTEGSERMVVEHAGRLMEPEGQLLLDFRSEPSGPSQTVSPIDEGVGEKESSGSASRVPVSAGEFFERGCRLDSDSETFGQAIEAYRQALRLDPDFADAHCNLGAVFYNRSQRAAARRHFERCLRLDANHVEAHFNLANLLEEDGCNEMALHHYRAGLVADPFYPDLHINLALLYEKMELAVKARQHWKRYLQLDPEGSWSEVARLRLEREG